MLLIIYTLKDKYTWEERVMESVSVDIKGIQNKLLEILLYFDLFCKEHNLKYYLCGGCLIGIERHKGFIPWDDDIDLFMPRPDYEKLRKIWNDEADISRYVFCITDKEHNYHNAGASIRDVNTTYINCHSKNEDIVQGLALEIIPLDGCPNSIISRCWQLVNAFAFNVFNFQRLPDNKGKLVRYLTMFIYLIIKSQWLRYKIWRFAEKQMSKYSWQYAEYITELTGSIHGMLLKHEKGDFDNVVYKEFEGLMLPVMKGYRKYLKRIWGDYMQLPPVEKRIAKHHVVFMDLDKSYTNYKGIYYCVNED